MSNELTAAKVAERLGVGRSTVNLWCRQGRFPSARLEDSPLGSYWVIPESDLKDFELPKRGRTPKSEGARASSRNGKVKVTPSKRGSKK
jgi:excisionase family DNA binding protein